MRDYQKQRGNPYLLPQNVYKQVLYMAKDYERLKDEREDILYAGAVASNMPRGSEISDPTQRKAERLDRIGDQLRAIEGAAQQIPEEYRSGVWNNVIYGLPYPITAGSATWKRWRARYVWQMARRVGLW